MSPLRIDTRPFMGSLDILGTCKVEQHLAQKQRITSYYQLLRYVCTILAWHSMLLVMTWTPCDRLITSIYFSYIVSSFSGIVQCLASRHPGDQILCILYMMSGGTLRLCSIYEVWIPFPMIRFRTSTRGPQPMPPPMFFLGPGRRDVFSLLVLFWEHLLHWYNGLTCVGPQPYFRHSQYPKLRFHLLFSYAFDYSHHILLRTLLFWPIWLKLTHNFRNSR